MLTKEKLAEYIGNVILCALKSDRMVQFTVEASDSDSWELVEEITVQTSEEEPSKICTVIFKSAISGIQSHKA